VLRRVASWVFFATLLAWSWAAVAGAVIQPVLAGRVGPVSLYLVVAVPFAVAPLVASWVWREAWREGPLLVAGPPRPGGGLLMAWLGPLGLLALGWAWSAAAGWGVVDLSGAALVERVAREAGRAAAAEVGATTAALPVPYPLLVLTSALATGPMVGVLLWAEEVGWRGVLHRELAGLGMWPAALLNGLLWGLWRAPLVALGDAGTGRPVEAVLVAVGVGIPIGALLVWVRASAGTVWAAALAAGMLAVLGRFHEVGYSDGDPFRIGVLGVSGGLAALAICGALWLGTRLRLGVPAAAGLPERAAG